MNNFVVTILLIIIIILLIFILCRDCSKKPQQIPKFMPKRKITNPNLCQNCKNNNVKVENGLNVMYMDGGSMECNGCGQKYHKCKNGLDRYGSPGPLLCEVCNPKNN